MLSSRNTLIAIVQLRLGVQSRYHWNRGLLPITLCRGLPGSEPGTLTHNPKTVDYFESIEDLKKATEASLEKRMFLGEKQMEGKRRKQAERQAQK